jgi:hydrogenase-1 operon protein HyaF
MSLDNIAIKVETSAPRSVGNIGALLNEIACRLEELAASSKTSLIDLKSLPFSPGEYEKLRISLGRGEVSARLEAIGVSEINETQFPGVWWVTHYNVEGDIIADLIEIAAIPEILRSQPEDVRGGLQHLQEIITQPSGFDE